jgi:predicted branched-subunit amino acid permease
MWTIATMNSGALAASHYSTGTHGPPMDVVMVFGFLAAFITLVIWMHRNQSRASMAALASGLACMAVYAFLQGAWPVGLAMSVWSIARFRQAIGKAGPRKLERAWVSPPMRWNEESRIGRMFGEGQLN